MIFRNQLLFFKLLRFCYSIKINSLPQKPANRYLARDKGRSIRKIGVLYKKTDLQTHFRDMKWQAKAFLRASKGQCEFFAGKRKQKKARIAFKPAAMARLIRYHTASQLTI